MHRHHPVSHDLELEQLAARFAHWRQCRATPTERIPASLWEQAVALCQTRPPSRVAKALGLWTRDLQQRCHTHALRSPLPAEKEPAVHFVDVSSVAWPPSYGVHLEIHRPDGTRLHLTSHETRVSLADLIRTFVEVKSCSN